MTIMFQHQPNDQEALHDCPSVVIAELTLIARGAQQQQQQLQSQRPFLVSGPQPTPSTATTTRCSPETEAATEPQDTMQIRTYCRQCHKDSCVVLDALAFPHMENFRFIDETQTCGLVAVRLPRTYEHTSGKKKHSNVEAGNIDECCSAHCLKKGSKWCLEEGFCGVGGNKKKRKKRGGGDNKGGVQGEGAKSQQRGVSQHRVIGAIFAIQDVVQQQAQQQGQQPQNQNQILLSWEFSITSLAVLPRYHGYGVGKSLMKFMLLLLQDGIRMDVEEEEVDEEVEKMKKEEEEVGGAVLCPPLPPSSGIAANETIPHPPLQSEDEEQLGMTRFTSTSSNRFLPNVLYPTCPRLHKLIAHTSATWTCDVCNTSASDGAGGDEKDFQEREFWGGQRVPTAASSSPTTSMCCRVCDYDMCLKCFNLFTTKNVSSDFFSEQEEVVPMNIEEEEKKEEDEETNGEQKNLKEEEKKEKREEESQEQQQQQQKADPYMCPKGHLLLEQKWNDWLCDMCDQKRGDVSIGCRECDYDLCRPCFNEKIFEFHEEGKKKKVEAATAAIERQREQQLAEEGALLHRHRRFAPHYFLLQVMETNAPAFALYRSFGFRPVSRLTDYYGKGLDAFQMVLREEDVNITL